MESTYGTWETIDLFEFTQYFCVNILLQHKTKPQTRRFTDNAPILNLSLAFESWKFIIGYKFDGFRFM